MKNCKLKLQFSVGLEKLYLKIQFLIFNYALAETTKLLTNNPSKIQSLKSKIYNVRVHSQNIHSFFLESEVIL